MKEFDVVALKRGVGRFRECLEGTIVEEDGVGPNEVLVEFVDDAGYTIGVPSIHRDDLRVTHEVDASPR